MATLMKTSTLARALHVTPGGSQTKSKAPGKVGPRDLRPGFPLFAERGMGPYLYCGGEKYLDFIGANAAVPLGYGRPELIETVAVAAGGGSLLSLPSDEEIDVSEILCHAMGTERVRWVKTGSEAVTAAVKIARAATGSSMVIVATHSYHGWHDWTLARFSNIQPSTHSMPNGVPSVLGKTIIQYDYEKVDPMEAVKLAHSMGARVAAIVIEPHRFLVDQGQQLQQARTAANEAGAVLIFDEMVYGLRWALAGAQSYYEAGAPDLSCYGKALGNGVPIACVTGKATIMDRAADLITSTYGGDRIGLAAARAVLEIYAKEDVIGKLWANGNAFFEEFRLAGGDRQRLEAKTVHFRINWRTAEEADDVLTRCAQKGILFHRDANNASAAMTEAEARHGARILAEELTAKIG